MGTGPCTRSVACAWRAGLPLRTAEAPPRGLVGCRGGLPVRQRHVGAQRRALRTRRHRTRGHRTRQCRG
ncbi:hypothetical protein N864_23740 [Intrasporangium chromatireducens Q5-1]|uniref:Uncharacterized protein n=1 Tax=Intrasporangium chromatireducens Q5-1 TaxID=584657 RepID=W9GM40_9MICO|nr:hypothetical protein N864_23740 [Intrasporangium chromatireducens Q5-1]